jgi:hypothetical protein
MSGRPCERETDDDPALFHAHLYSLSIQRCWDSQRDVLRAAGVLPGSR